MLTWLRLRHFRRFEFAQWTFQHQYVAFVGPNASGKSTLLEAIHFVATGRGWQPAIYSVRMGAEAFHLTGRWQRAGHVPEEVMVYYHGPSRSKKILVNKQALRQVSHLLGRFPVLSLRMESLQWVWGKNEWRRKQLDWLLGQLSRDYLETLIRHHHLLQQRNQALRKGAKRDLLLLYGEQLSQTSHFLRQRRHAFLDRLRSHIRPLLRQLLPDKSKDLVLTYDVRHQDEAWQELLEQDLRLGYTTWGAQRDALAWQWKDQPVQVALSRGEGARLALATVLAFWQLMAQEKGPTTLLVDDWEAFQDQRFLRSLPELIQHHAPAESPVYLASLRPPSGQWQIIHLKNNQ